MVITMKNIILQKAPQIAATLFLTLLVSAEATAAPVAYPDRLHTTVGVPKTVGVLWNDRGRGLYISKVNHYSKHGGRLYTIAGGKKVHYTPKAGFRGTDTFWYEITDAHGRTNSSKVTVNVRGHQRARAQPKQHYYQPRKRQTNYSIGWSEPGFSISYSKPGGIQAEFDAPSHHYVQPRTNGRGHWQGGGSAPVGHADVFTTYAASGQVPLHVLSNDQGHGLKVQTTNAWTKNGGQAWVVNNHTGSYVMYTPKPGFYGTDTLWYVLRDANGRTNSTRVNINVR